MGDYEINNNNNNNTQEIREQQNSNGIITEEEEEGGGGGEHHQQYENEIADNNKKSLNHDENQLKSEIDYNNRENAELIHYMHDNEEDKVILDKTKSLTEYLTETNEKQEIVISEDKNIQENHLVKKSDLNKEHEKKHEKSKSRDKKRERPSESRERHGSRRTRSRHRSRSDKRRGSRSSRRNKSEHKRSKSPSRRKRKTLFDIPPAPGSELEQLVKNPELIGTGDISALASVVPSLMPGVLPAADPAGMVDPTVGIVTNPLLQGSNAQATRHARRVYVGGLPPTANEQSIATFMSHALAAVGGTSQGPGVVGNAVVNVYINREKNFAFVEFRTVEETSNAMALDGILFEGVSVRVRRPNDYNPAAAAHLGPSVPNPSLNLGAVGLSSNLSTLSDANERIFIGGLPYYLTEEQCKELLGTFGTIKSFDLIKDKDQGVNADKYGFVVYSDPSVTDVACQGLNGLKMGDRQLTVKRATELQALNALLPSSSSSGALTSALVGASRVIALSEAVTIEELRDDEEYTDIYEDMLDECRKFGEVKNLVIPRPPQTENDLTPNGLGKVIVEFDDMVSAAKARSVMNGRKFNGRAVIAAFISEEKFEEGEYDCEI